MGNPGQGIREKGEGKVKEGRERGNWYHTGISIKMYACLQTTRCHDDGSRDVVTAAYDKQTCVGGFYILYLRREANDHVTTD